MCLKNKICQLIVFECDSDSNNGTEDNHIHINIIIYNIMTIILLVLHRLRKIQVNITGIKCIVLLLNYPKY